MVQYTCPCCGYRAGTEERTRAVQCPACSAVFVVPNQYARLNALYDRAAEARAARSYDEAEVLYGQILKLDSTDTAANWGFLLSKYGVEVSRGAEAWDRITFRRVEHASFLDDPAYARMMEYCPADSAYYYESMARRIDAKHRQLLEYAKLATEKPVEIYIDSTAGAGTQDYLLARQIAGALNEAGYTVFLPSVMLAKVGENERDLYEMAFAEQAKSMLVVLTPFTDLEDIEFKSVWMRYMQYARKDPSRKLFSAFRGMEAEGLPIALRGYQSFECSGSLDELVSKVNEMFGRNQDVTIARQIREDLNRGEAALAEGNWASAADSFRSALNKDVSESGAHFGIVRANTQNLTVPVYDEATANEYHFALDTAKDPAARDSYVAAMRRLMADPAWKKLSSLTNGLHDYAANSKPEVTEAIRVAQEFLPRDDADGRFRALEAYRKRAALERDVNALTESYREADPVVQPLFAEWKKNEDAIGVHTRENRSGSGSLFRSRLALAASVLMVAALILLTWHFNTDQGYSNIWMTAANVCFYIGLLLSVYALICFDNRLWVGFLLGSGVIVLIIRHFAKTSVQPWFLIMTLFPPILFTALRIITVSVSANKKKREREIGQYLAKRKKLAGRLSAAYGEDLRKIYAKHSFRLPDQLPTYSPAADAGEEEKKAVQALKKGTVLPALHLLMTPVWLIAILLAATAVTNSLYATGWDHIVAIDSNYTHTAALREDGRVVTAGRNLHGERETKNWSDIAKVLTGREFTAALTKNGTVCVAAPEDSPLREAEQWTGIIDISVSDRHILGLREDGTCVVAGVSEEHAREVAAFDHAAQIVAISHESGEDLSMAVTSDGRVLSTTTGFWINQKNWLDANTGEGEDLWDVAEIYGRVNSVFIRSREGDLLGLGLDRQHQLSQMENLDTTDVKDFYVNLFSLGLKEDGTLLFAGSDAMFRSEASEIRDAAALTHGNTDYALILLRDGTVRTVGANINDRCNVSGWSGITAVASGLYTSYGIREDGGVESAGLGICGMTYTAKKNPLEVIRFWISMREW